MRVKRAVISSAVVLVLSLAVMQHWEPSSYGSVRALAVDCDAGEQIQAKLAVAKPGDTIVVNGTCNENVLFLEETARLTLDGGGTAVINSPVGVLPGAIEIRGRGITIRGFTINGGGNGINILRGGTAVIDGNIIQNAAGQGVPGRGSGINLAQHSYAQILNNTIQDNAANGIGIHESSYGRIGLRDVADAAPGPNTIRNNGGNGVLVQRSSSARVGVSTISDNGGSGVLITGASHAAVASNVIDGNGRGGITLTQNSALQLGGDIAFLNPPNETSVNNHGYAINCSLNSSVDGRLGTLAGADGIKNFDSSCTDGSRL